MSTNRALPAVAEPITLAAALTPLWTVLIWSGNVIVTEAASGLISPGSISFYRWLIAFVVLAPFVGKAAWKNRAVLRDYWWELAALGALGMVIYQSLAYEAAKTTTAVNMGVMLIAIAANSLYGVLLKRWSIPLPMWQQLFWQIGFATLMLLPVWLMGTISPITAANLPLVLYAAIPTSLIAPLYWMMGIQRLGAARTALFINLVPVLVAVLAWAILGEQLHGYHAIGGGLALLGVGIGLRQAKVARGEQVPSADQAAWETEEL